MDGWSLAYQTLTGTLALGETGQLAASTDIDHVTVDDDLVEWPVDAEGDGMDDVTMRSYCQGFGWVDVDGDGVNDAYMDLDGDGINDWDGHHHDGGYPPGPGEHGHGGPMMDPEQWPWPGGMGMG